MVVEKIPESVQEAADNDLPEIASNAIGEYSEHVQGYRVYTASLHLCWQLRFIGCSCKSFQVDV